MTTTATVRLWGTDIGAVSIGDVGDAAIFQYEPTFVGSGIEVAPITMPLDHRIYTFPTLGWEAFRGLPGLLSDSLPDKYGNALIDTWLAAQGRTPESFNAVERLCYIGKRGMGALEFVPAAGPVSAHGDELQVAALVALASQVLAARTDLKLKLDSALTTDSLQDILSVGTSAGGARAKAVIAWNPSTQVVRSGQIEAGDGFEYWLLKLDGVSENRDKELADAKGYGAIEYAYSLMARAAGIEMAECRLLEEGGRKHFMTKRFDRRADGEKVHMQTLGAIAHFDLNLAGAYSYEQAIMVMRRLELSIDQIEQQFRRMVFNVIARNQDDHVKNIAYLMDRRGQWQLSPAFDLTYSYQPSGEWTSQHQMTINAKRDNFVVEDFRHCAEAAALKKGRAAEILEEVRVAVDNWPSFAAKAKVTTTQAERIAATHRLDIQP